MAQLLHVWMPGTFKITQCSILQSPVPQLLHMPQCHKDSRWPIFIFIEVTLNMEVITKNNIFHKHIVSLQLLKSPTIQYWLSPQVRCPKKQAQATLWKALSTGNLEAIPWLVHWWIYNNDARTIFHTQLVPSYVCLLQTSFPILKQLVEVMG